MNENKKKMKDLLQRTIFLTTCYSVASRCVVNSPFLLYERCDVSIVHLTS